MSIKRGKPHICLFVFLLNLRNFQVSTWQLSDTSVSRKRSISSPVFNLVQLSPQSLLETFSQFSECSRRHSHWSHPRVNPRKHYNSFSSSLLFCNNQPSIDDDAKKLEQVQTSTVTTSTNLCRYCSKQFRTRNSLFRHLRNDPVCSPLLTASSNITVAPSIETWSRQTFAVVFGYRFQGTGFLTDLNTNKRDDYGIQAINYDLAAHAGERLLRALKHTIQDIITSDGYDVRREGDAEVEIVGYTQTSIAGLRHGALSQEYDCAAAGDVLVATLLVPPTTNHSRESKWFGTPFLGKLQEDLVCQENDTNKSNHQKNGKVFPNLLVKVFACKDLNEEQDNKRQKQNEDQTKSRQTFHAEKWCTQRVYHYMLPLSWLPEGQQAIQWCKSNQKILSSSTKVEKNGTGHHREPKSNITRETPESIRRFKWILKGAESPKLPQTMEQAKEGASLKTRLATTRFHSFTHSERRPWHNYADPTLYGDASPNNEPVWTIIDRTRIVQFLRVNDNKIQQNETNKQDDVDDDDDEIVAVIEFRGNDFVKQQIRRIIGTVLAMTHGWLPSDFLEKSTRADRIVETPIAPPGRLYFANSRFHFEERKAGGRQIFDPTAYKDVITVRQKNRDDDNHDNYLGGIDWIQEQMFQSLSSSSSSISRAEKLWLEDLRTVVSPRIRAQIVSQANDFDNTKKTTETSIHRIRKSQSLAKSHHCSSAYELVLRKLRQIVRSGRWPETSKARSNVIQWNDNVHDADDGKSKKKKRNGGSFTVVNPTIYGYENWSKLPLGNSLFPELVDAIFNLEAVLATQTRDRVNTMNTVEEGVTMVRPPSTHCAVNCNAEFTPHVDSGTGSGQSLSMIVGLGDYSIGGELFVEGRMFDIQYRPIEFDGWKLRHWTNRFKGERFSLVWFTPKVE